LKGGAGIFFYACQIKLENSRAELSEVENKLKAAREEKERKESAFGAMKLAIEQLLQRTLASCRLQDRVVVLNLLRFKTTCGRFKSLKLKPTTKCF